MHVNIAVYMIFFKLLLLELARVMVTNWLTMHAHSIKVDATIAYCTYCMLPLLLIYINAPYYFYP